MSNLPATLKDSEIDAENPQHFDTLVRRYQGSVFGFLGRMGFDQSQAEDIAQEAFLKAWRALKSYSSEKAAFSTWLFTIVRNTALSEIAKHKRRPLSFDTEAVEREANESEGYDLVKQSQQRVRLNQALAQLTPEDREVIALSYNDELNSKEAAGVLGCAPGAFRTRLTRAKQRLSQLWESADD